MGEAAINKLSYFIDILLKNEGKLKSLDGHLSKPKILRQKRSMPLCWAEKDSKCPSCRLHENA